MSCAKPVAFSPNAKRPPTMFDRIRSIVLRVLRVPTEPTPPLGAPGSIRIFRAARNFYRLRLAEWSLAQFGAAVGITFSVVFLFAVEREIEHARHARETSAPVGEDASAMVVPSRRQMIAERALTPYRQAVGFAATLPPHVLLILDIVKIGGVVVFLVQLPFSYAAVRLEYEQHWYIVTDRSLRIRHGLVAMTESTMSFANIQQVVVHQGPVQRLLGLADVRVQSAGSGESKSDHKKHEESLHIGIFRGVANADEIRDLILERLRLFRESGLGDSDELRHAQHIATAPVAPLRPVVDAAALDAAREVLTEARALRTALENA